MDRATQDRIDEIETRATSGPDTKYRVELAAVDFRWLIEQLRSTRDHCAKLETRVHNQKMQLRAFEKKRREAVEE